jgi:hypothetical protein
LELTRNGGLTLDQKIAWQSIHMQRRVIDPWDGAANTNTVPQNA